MKRFMTVSPANDTQPWMAKDTMDSSGIESGDMGTIDLRRLAAEFVVPDDKLAKDVQEGSPFSSSPTLSAQAYKIKRSKEGVRVRKDTRLRRKN